jgi:hypothetical protein
MARNPNALSTMKALLFVHNLIACRRLRAKSENPRLARNGNS